MVVDEHFAIPIPADYPLEAAGPVMCAGVTMYDPLKKFNCGPGTRLAIIGLGGLGQMGIKLGKILGADVTVISRSAAKEKIAIGFGADHFLVSADAEQLEKAKGSFDLILNTIPAYHSYTEYNKLVAKNGTQVLIGLHDGTVAGLLTEKVTCGSSKFVGSMIGGIPATNEVMQLVAKHKITLETKLVGVEELNSIFEKLGENNDDGIRYVLDLENTLNEGAFEKCKDVPAPKLAKHTKGISLSSVTRELMWQLFTFKWL
jgi:D-arabinose 1-dehydrogenase-like Zn-dependent alcohol dehydrogenase